MNIQKINAQIAVITDDKSCITDTDRALSLVMDARYQTDVNRFIVSKELFCDDFFILSNGLAGEILQKFVNYHIKIAIVGDFSMYTSKALHDFIVESNQGNNVFFVSSQEEAIKKLESTISTK